ncbi:hypothetical protein ACLK1V_20975 [Escherichia coli]
MKKLSSGRGNVLAQAEAFRGLGVEIKREINPDLAEQAVSRMKSIDFGRFRSSRWMKLINAMMNIISSRASP